MPPKYPCKRIDLLFGITITIRAVFPRFLFEYCATANQWGLESVATGRPA